jgi:Tfp pilus assembly protein PilE
LNFQPGILVPYILNHLFLKIKYKCSFVNLKDFSNAVSQDFGYSELFTFTKKSFKMVLAEFISKLLNSESIDMLNKCFKKPIGFKKIAFSLAEVMLVCFIIGIVSVVSIRIASSRKTYAIKMMYFAANKNLKQAADYAQAMGYKADDGSVVYKFPDTGNKFCNYLKDIFNIVETENCSATASAGDFVKGKSPAPTPSFRLSNDVTFYNVGSNVINKTGSTDGYYDLFIDVNGQDKGDNVLNADVFEFYVTPSAKFYPSQSSAPANNSSFITAHVNYLDSNEKVQRFDLRAPYLRAICESGSVETQLFNTLCTANGYSVNTTYCSTSMSQNTCAFALNMPGY